MKRINIYITNENKKQLNDLQAKYKVSWSTIVDIICFETTHIKIQKKLNVDIENNYIHKKGNNKTSVKPQIFADKGILRECKDKNMYATNCLILYLDKKIKEYVLDQETLQEYYNKINQKLSKCKETYYNYNNFLRMNMRSFKENKDYYRRKLDQLEQQGAN